MIIRLSGFVCNWLSDQSQGKMENERGEGEILFFIVIAFFNYGNMITHLQETWKIQNKVAYSSTIY